MRKHDIPGIMASFSLAFWAFTGLPLWSHIGPDDSVRAAVLYTTHIVAIAYSWIARSHT